VLNKAGLNGLMNKLIHRRRRYLRDTVQDAKIKMPLTIGSNVLGNFEKKILKMKRIS